MPSLYPPIGTPQKPAAEEGADIAGQLSAIMGQRREEQLAQQRVIAARTVARYP